MNLGRIILLFTFCLAFLLTDILIAQKEYKPIVKKSIFFGKSKAIKDDKMVLHGPVGEMKKAAVNPFPYHDYDMSQIVQECLLSENVQNAIDYSITKYSNSLITKN